MIAIGPMIRMETIITISSVANLDWFGKVGGKVGCKVGDNDEDKDGDSVGDKDAVVIGCGKIFADDGEGGTRCVVPPCTAVDGRHASTRKLSFSSKG